MGRVPRDNYKRHCIMTSLFNDIIFGPVRSRRLGLSLGVNLLPVESKLCSFDCIYCECGWERGSPPEADGSTAAKMWSACCARRSRRWSPQARRPT